VAIWCVEVVGSCWVTAWWTLGANVSHDRFLFFALGIVLTRCDLRAGKSRCWCFELIILYWAPIRRSLMTRETTHLVSVLPQTP
jgi:hypothetical protein